MIPLKPAIKPWMRVASNGHAVAFEYGQAVRVLEGEASRYLLPAMLPLLDGTRTVEKITASIGEEFAEPINALLEVLARHDLLIALPAERTSATTAVNATIDFLASTGTLPAAVADAIAATRIGLVGSSGVTDVVGEILSASGVKVSRPGWEVDDVNDDRADLFVVAPGASDIPRLDDWNAAAVRAGRGWLPVLPSNGVVAIVGPLVLPGETACYRCFQLRRAANIDYGEWFARLDGARMPFPTPPHLSSLLAGLAADVALRWLAAADPALPGAFYALEHRPSVSVSAQRVYRVPRCPTCSPLASTTAPLPWFDEGARSV